MNANVDKLQKEFLRRIEDNFNEAYYFIESCFSDENKFTSRSNLNNLSLQIFLEKNTHDSPVKEIIKKTRLYNLKPQDIIVKNNIVDDTWEQNDW